MSALLGLGQPNNGVNQTSGYWGAGASTSTNAAGNTNMGMQSAYLHGLVANQNAQNNATDAHTTVNLGGFARQFGSQMQDIANQADQNRIDANHDAQVAKIQAAGDAQRTAEQQQAVQNQQAANAATRTTLLGQIADPSKTAAVQNVDQSALNTQQALASSTSTNAYQSGDLAQTGMATSDMSTGATGQSAIDEASAGAQARQDALTELGQLDDSTTAQDLQISQTDVARQQGEIQNTFAELTSQASGLDAAQKQALTQYGTQLNYYMQQYQTAVAQGEAGRASALGWLKLSLGVLATAGAAVATVATAGAASPALVAAGAADASLAK